VQPERDNERKVIRIRQHDGIQDDRIRVS
jgi:hypothetical protein